MPDFNPANTIIRNGWEDLAPGLPSATLDGYHRLGPGGELIAPTFNGVPIGEIDGVAVDQGDVLTTVALGPKAINMRLRNDLGSLRYLARFLRQGAAVTTPAGATLTRQHIWDANQSSVDFDKRLTVEISRDNGLVWSLRGCDVQQIIFTFEGGELTNYQAVILWRHMTHFAEPTVESDVTPNTEQASLSGLLSQANFDLGTAADANKVWIKISDITNIAASPPNVQALAKVGAGAYGTDAFTIYGGTKSNGEPRLNQVLDSNGGMPIGTTRLPVYIAATALTDWEVNDEWSWVQKAEWTPTLETRPLFNNACAAVTVDGESEVLNSCTVTLTRQLVLPGGGSWIGSGFPLTLSDAGRVRHEVTFAKDQLDTELVEKIVYGKSFDFSMDLRTDVLIDSGTQYDHRFLLEANSLAAVGGSEHKTTTAEDAREETITCVASGTPPVRATIWSPITDFTV